MRPRARRTLIAGAPLVAAAALAGALIPTFASGSSHREAPAISQDPTADSTDVYAFRSPDRPDTATIIANYVPFQEPAGGPNFHRFSDDAVYDVAIDNTGDGRGDIIYRLNFQTSVKTKGSFLYNTGAVTYDAAADTYRNLSLVQTYSVTKITRNRKGKLVARVVGRNLLTPPNNVGPKSTPDYESALVPPAMHTLRDGARIFAGQRDDPFFVDLGGTFDLVNFRSAPPGAFSEGGVDGLRGYSVNSIAIQVPIKHVTRNRKMATDTNSPTSVVGVYTRALRPHVSFRDGKPRVSRRQVSRLAQPLVNEVLIPLGKKDLWNRTAPYADNKFDEHYLAPELAGIFNAFFDIGAPTENRVDLTTLLLKGIPPDNGLGLPTTQVGSKPRTADMIRVNLAVEPTPIDQQDRLGLLAGQADGFPNGRRLVDDVVDIEERAVAGVLAPAFGLPAPNGSNAALAGQLGDGVNANDKPFGTSFPYLAPPNSGFDSIPHP